MGIVKCKESVNAKPTVPSEICKITTVNIVTYALLSFCLLVWVCVRL